MVILQYYNGVQRNCCLINLPEQVADTTTIDYETDLITLGQTANASDKQVISRCVIHSRGGEIENLIGEERLACTVNIVRGI